MSTEPSTTTDGSSESGRKSRRRPFLALVLLFVLPLSLRLIPIEHGWPRNYVPDTHLVNNALGMARDRDVIPPVNRYSSYPYLTSYILVPLYGVQYAIGRLDGTYTRGRDFERHALVHPEDVFLPARYVIAILGALTVWVTFRAGRAAGLRAGAWVAAWLVATAMLHVQFSVEERPWVPLSLWMAVAAWGSITYATRGGRRALLATTVAAACAFATHQIGLFLAGLVFLTWLLGPPRDSSIEPQPSLAKRLPQLAGCALLFIAVAIPLGHPYLLRYGLTRDADVVGGEAGAELGGVSIGGQRLLPKLDFDVTGPVLSSFLSYDGVLAVLGVLGLALALRRRGLWPVAMFTIVWSVFFAVYHNARVRYYLPVEAFFAIPAGLLVERFATRVALRPLLVVLLAIPLVQSLRLVRVLGAPDTRAVGETRLFELPESARVAIDRYGPAVDLDAESIERLREIRQRRDEDWRAREEHRHARLEWAAQGNLDGVAPGLDAIRVEELFGFDAEKGTVEVRESLREWGATPEALLRRLGVTHFLYVERRPGIDRNLLEELVADWTPVWVVDPRRDVQRPAECVLPMEMRAPALALWGIERPGPRLTLYELP